jgi:hypothetical protein
LLPVDLGCRVSSVNTWWATFLFLSIYIDECDYSGSPDLSKGARHSMTKGALLLYMIYLYRKSESQIPMLRLPWNNERRPAVKKKSSLCQSVVCYHSGDWYKVILIRLALSIYFTGCTPRQSKWDWFRIIHSWRVSSQFNEE